LMQAYNSATTQRGIGRKCVGTSRCPR
jgi:hypothetical protein